MVGQGNTTTFRELKHHFKFNTAYNGYCTIDGVACTQVGNDREVFLDAKGKVTDYAQVKRQDGRSEANKNRTGQKLVRTGKYVRSTEVRRTVIAWVAAIGGIHKVKFTTVTFPEGTPDHIAKSCFNIFLTRWRKAVPELSYLWTAERQQNQTLHFHLVQDRYTNIGLLNRWMKASLINKIAEIPNYSKEQAMRYNGVDIGSEVYSKLGIEKYLAKYLTKAQKSGINQPWHRSRIMGELVTKVRFSMERVRSIMNYAYLHSQNIDQELRVFENDYCLYISWPPEISDLIKWHLDKHNRSRWKGLRKKVEYRSPVQLAAEAKELQLSETKKETGLQLDMQHLFPVTNYQTRNHRHVSVLR